MWWHPLLHIVSESDFATIISHKHPQFVTYSKSYAPSQEIDPNETPSVPNTPTQKRLSSLVTNLFSSSSAPSPGSSAPASPGVTFEKAASIISKLANKRKQQAAAAAAKNMATATGPATPEASPSPSKPRFRGLATKMLAVSKVQSPVTDKKRTPTPIPQDRSPERAGSNKSRSAEMLPNVLETEIQETEGEAAALVAASGAGKDAPIADRQRKYADFASKMLLSSPPVTAERKRHPTPIPTDLKAPSVEGSGNIYATIPVLAAVTEEPEEKTSWPPTGSGKSMEGVVAAALHRKARQSLLAKPQIIDQFSEPKTATALTPKLPHPLVIVNSDAKEAAPQSLEIDVKNHELLALRSNSVQSSLSSPRDSSINTISNTPSLTKALTPSKRTSVHVSHDNGAQQVEDQVLQAVIAVDEVASLKKEASYKRRASAQGKKRSGSFMRGRLSSFLARNTRRPSSIAPDEEKEDDDPDNEDDDEAEAEDAFDTYEDMDTSAHTELVGHLIRRRTSSMLSKLSTVLTGRKSISRRTSQDVDLTETEAGAKQDVVDDDNKLFMTGKLANEPEVDVAPEVSSPKDRKSTHRRATRQSQQLGPGGRNSRASKRTSLIASVSKAIGRMSGARTTNNTPKGRRTQSKSPKMFCHFDDEVIRIPGCHGNSVFRFDFLAGE